MDILLIVVMLYFREVICKYVLSVFVLYDDFLNISMCGLKG